MCSDFTWMCCIRVQAELSCCLQTEQVRTRGSVLVVFVSASSFSPSLSTSRPSSSSCGWPDPVTLGEPTLFWSERWESRGGECSGSPPVIYIPGCSPPCLAHRRALTPAVHCSWWPCAGCRQPTPAGGTSSCSPRRWAGRCWWGLPPHLLVEQQQCEE